MKAIIALSSRTVPLQARLAPRGWARDRGIFLPFFSVVFHSLLYLSAQSSWLNSCLPRLAMRPDAEWLGCCWTKILHLRLLTPMCAVSSSERSSSEEQEWWNQGNLSQWNKKVAEQLYTFVIIHWFWSVDSGSPMIRHDDQTRWSTPHGQICTTTQPIRSFKD